MAQVTRWSFLRFLCRQCKLSDEDRRLNRIRPSRPLAAVSIGRQPARYIMNGEPRLENKHSSERTRVRRLPARGSYEEETIRSIIDEGLICHVGFATEGSPVVIPMTYGRHDDTLYLHGSVASRLLRTLGRGAEVCATITLLDGMVLARSVFHHSMNYRSVVIFGQAREVTDPDERMLAMEAIVEHLVPGRWKEARLPNEQELLVTTVIAVPLAEASAKIRTGPPKDDEEDYELPIWAGEIPLTLRVGEPLADPRLKDGIEPSETVRGYRRGR